MAKNAVAKTWDLPIVNGRRYSDPSKQPGALAGALVDACNALSVGSYASFSSGAQSAFNNLDLAWQTAFWHTTQNHRIHLFGKPANADTNWKHQYYNVSTNTWTVVSSGQWNNPGHVYGNSTGDSSTGDVYIARGGMDNAGADNYKKIARYQTGSGWGYVPASGDIYASGLVSHSNGVAYHPNLFGSGDGGLVIDQQFRTMFWRKSTDAVYDTAHGDSVYGNNAGAAVYWPAQDCVVVGGGYDAGIKLLLKITPNGVATPTSTALSAPPIATGGYSHQGGVQFGSLHVHPGNANKLMILETNGQRAWTSTDGNTWTQVSDHPFTQTPRVVCSLAGGLGCFWAVGQTDALVHFSTIWKPAT